MARETAIRSETGSQGQGARVKPTSVVLGLVALGLVGATLSGARLPLIAGESEALVALVVVGMAMCTSGPLGMIAAKGAWLSWSATIGTVLGVAALLVAAAGVGWLSLPGVEGARSAFNVLAVLVALKSGFGVLHRLTA